jgi:uncharacterized spore protein YtfJ
MRRSVFSGKEAAMDIISEVLDMAAEIVELIVTEILRRKKEKRTRQNKENERSRKRQCTTK